MRTINGLEYFSSPLFKDEVVHAFLSRAGGVSQPPFESLNFDPRDTDSKENVEENWARLKEAFGVESLATVSQVHRNAVVNLKGEPSSPVEADAIITGNKGMAIGILTADCLPILLHDPVNGAVAAVHAGWKGTALGVALNTVHEMGKAFGTRPGDLIAALGPSIGPCCYTVGENVYEEFQRLGRNMDSFTRLDDGLRLDLGFQNMSQLLDSGLRPENISGGAPCTYCSKGFFSYRRDGGRTGRQLSFIMLKRPK